MHYLCPNDLNHCVRGTLWKNVVVRPSIPTIWLIQEDFDLIQKEVTTLKKAGFSFDHNCVQKLFGP